MMSATASDVTVTFEGFTEGTDIWAATTANFLIDRPHHPAKEVSVLLTDAGAAYLSSSLGIPDSPEFRQHAARMLGQFWMERAAAAGRRIDPVVQISRNVLDGDAELMGSMRGAVGRLQPQRAANESEPPAQHE
jgi:hypothetical protein